MSEKLEETDDEFDTIYRLQNKLDALKLLARWAAQFIESRGYAMYAEDKRKFEKLKEAAK